MSGSEVFTRCAHCGTGAIYVPEFGRLSEAERICAEVERVIAAAEGYPVATVATTQEESEAERLCREAHEREYGGRRELDIGASPEERIAIDMAEQAAGARRQ